MLGAGGEVDTEEGEVAGQGSRFCDSDRGEN